MQRQAALVTGASGGLGLAIATLLAERSIDLVLVSRTEKKLAALARDLSKRFGITAHVMPADLSKPSAAQDIFRACRKKGLRIDMLINNAGAGIAGEHLAMDEDSIDAMIRLNVNALTALCMLFGREMKARKSGMILNIASLVSQLPMPFFTAYGATKAYVVSYSRALRSELRSFGVSVTCVLPGFIDTGFEKSAGLKSPSYSRMAKSLGMSADAVARACVRAMFRRKALSVAGFMNRIAYFLIKFIPKQFLSNMAYRAMKRYF
ncbi:MAG: SDR family oxidoreductase [Spirochaetota bacterium]